MAAWALVEKAKMPSNGWAQAVGWRWQLWGSWTCCLGGEGREASKVTSRFLVQAVGSVRLMFTEPGKSSFGEKSGIWDIKVHKPVRHCRGDKEELGKESGVWGSSLAVKGAGSCIG